MRYEDRFSTIDGEAMVYCASCETFRPEANFAFVKATQKLHSSCVDCRRKTARDRYVKKGRAGSGKKQKEAAWSSRKKGELWLCTKCGVAKPITEYNKIRSKCGTAPSHCRECQSLANKRLADTRRPILKAQAEQRRAERMAKRQAELLKCQRCGETKPRSEWPVEGGAGVKTLKYCCSTKVRSHAQVASDIATQSKECSSCGLRKPFSDFSPNKLSKDGRQKTCRPCRSAKVHSGEWNGNLRRQSIINQRSDGSITTDFINQIFATKICPCCDGWMERDDKVLDHIIPLKLGGGHTASNVMVLCWSCNSGKSAHHPTKWLKMLREDAAERMRAAYAKMGLNFD